MVNRLNNQTYNMEKFFFCQKTTAKVRQRGTTQAQGKGRCREQTSRGTAKKFK